MRTYIEEDWLVRDVVHDRLDETLMLMSNQVLDCNIDWKTDAESMGSLIDSYFSDVADLTMDELEYILTYVQSACIYCTGLRSGAITEADGLVKISKKFQC